MFDPVSKILGRRLLRDRYSLNKDEPVTEITRYTKQELDRDYARRYYNEKKDDINEQKKRKARHRKYYIEHIDEEKERRRKYSIAHRERKAELRRKYDLEHPEARKIWSRNWREKHRQLSRENTRKWYYKNLEKSRELKRLSSARISAEHPEKVEQYRKKHARNVKEGTVQHRWDSPHWKRAQQYDKLTLQAKIAEIGQAKKGKLKLRKRVGNTFFWEKL